MIGEEVFRNPLSDPVDSPTETVEVPPQPTPQPRNVVETPEPKPAEIGVSSTETYGSSNFGNENRSHRTEEINIDLSAEDAILVDISDALSERDKVKYTVHTRTKLPDLISESSVVREHDEFIWLHDVLEENEEYAGFIIPPAPPKPDFEASREKLQKLGEGESTMTKEEFLKMKHDLEQDYLAQFKKTVAMHEVFLQRIAAHSVFSKDTNFRIFLQYDNELSVRGKNKKEQVESFWKRFTQSADEVLLSGQKDVDEFFEREKNYLIEYNTHIKEAAARSEKMITARKHAADTHSVFGDTLEKMARTEPDKSLGRTLTKASDTFHKLRKIEARSANDEELKLTDTLAYFARDTQAAKDLLYRRMRCLANYEAANKNLERARAKNREIQKAEAEQTEACKKFEEISTLAKTELQDLKKRRVMAFKKNLTDLAQLEIKHAKAHLSLLDDAIGKLKETLW